ncbi:MAG: UDP-N-acetylmuramate dehydrogenase [Flavobacteriales bacterium]
MFEKHVSLKAFNTFGIDVKSELFANISTVDSLRELAESAPFKNQDRLILGGGSNILFTRDFKGLVIKNELKGIELIGEDDNHYFVKAWAGERWHDLVMHCVENGYAGIENMALIPGSVGASPIQNIGAYGAEIKDVFHSLEAFHVDEKITKTFSHEECGFGYRDSVFKQHEKGKWIILSVTYRLLKRPALNTAYGAIEQELERMEVEHIKISDVAQAVMSIRMSKLPNPEHIGNAGSFFKNPVVPLSIFREIQKHHNNAPSFPIDEELVKVPAGWLIEKAGWKGKSLGRYGVHDMQALVLVNYGGATGKEIYDLSTRIIEDIQDQFSITLEREVNIL